MSAHSRCRCALTIGLLLLALCSLLQVTVAGLLQEPDRALSSAVPVAEDPVAPAADIASADGHGHVFCGAAGCSGHCHSTTDLCLPVVDIMPRYRPLHLESIHSDVLARGFRQTLLRPPIDGLAAGSVECTVLSLS